LLEHDDFSRLVKPPVYSNIAIMDYCTDPVSGGFMDPGGDYYRTHDPLNFIGGDQSATVAAHSMYVPPSMFNLPQPPSQHYQQVRAKGGKTCLLNLDYNF